MLTALFVAHLLTLCIVAGVASILRACERWSCSAELTMPTAGPWRYNVDNGARYSVAIGELLFSVRNPFRTMRDRCASFGDPREALARNGVDVYRTVPLTALVQRTWPPRPNPWPLRRRMFAGWIDAQRHAFQVRALLTYNALRYRSGLYVRLASLWAMCASLGVFLGSAGDAGSGALVSCATVAFVAWYTHAAARFGIGTVPGLAMVLPLRPNDASALQWERRPAIQVRTVEGTGMDSWIVDRRSQLMLCENTWREPARDLWVSKCSTWAISRMYMSAVVGPGVYRITHVPTGLRLGSERETRAHAVECCEALERARIDSGAPRGGHTEDGIRVFSDAFREPARAALASCGVTV